MDRRSLFFTAPRETAVRETTFSVEPDEVVVRTRASAINAGTELLIYRGEAPSELPADVTIESLDGDLSYPVRYGYAAVGDVVAAGDAVDDEWEGRTVFSFNPHDTAFAATPDQLVPVPDAVDPATMTMLPSAETATSLVLDGQPTVGERVVVFGAGIIGLFTLGILSAFPLGQLVAVEPVPERREHARRMGADVAVAPEDLDDVISGEQAQGADLLYELSGQPAALDDAVTAAGYDSRVVVGSWYGTKRASLDLGAGFHRDRISIESSQVSTLAPKSRGRWDKQRRLSTALEQLQRLDTDPLVTHHIPFDDAPSAYERLDDGRSDCLQVLLTYDD
ncbi:zinc-binding alcohol dehydrogenase [Halolamina sp.]|uniref:zinc-dependent alcohol dehydrogenase n=1 Tax=Halolamina sp. TaxID=1940283 RepID=UPI00067813B9